MTDVAFYICDECGHEGPRIDFVSEIETVENLIRKWGGRKPFYAYKKDGATHWKCPQCWALAFKLAREKSEIPGGSKYGQIIH